MSSMSASVWMPVANYDLRRAGCVLFSFRFHLVRSRSSVGVRRVRALDAQTGTTKRSLKTESDWKPLLVSNSPPQRPRRSPVTIGSRASGATTTGATGSASLRDNGRGRLLWRFPHFLLARGSRWITDRPGETPTSSTSEERSAAYFWAPADSWVATGMISILRAFHVIHFAKAN